MNASRADVESGALHKQSRRCGRVTLLVMALQNLLLTGCLLAMVYVYWTQEQPDSPKDVHIEFAPISNFRGNKSLEFMDVVSQHQMDLSEDKMMISTQCMGPYVVYMDVCHKGANEVASKGTLKLLVLKDGNEESLDSFEMNTTHEICRRHQTVVYLKTDEKAKLRLIDTTPDFRVTKVTVGFSYLLSSRCENE